MWLIHHPCNVIKMIPYISTHMTGAVSKGPYIQSADQPPLGIYNLLSVSEHF